MIRIPVMFLVEVGSVITTIEFIDRPSLFVGLVTHPATLDTVGLTFAGFLTGVIVIVGGLIYFPMLILGPIGERIVG
jgi:K+-transporting ATPase A subunit